MTIRLWVHPLFCHSSSYGSHRRNRPNVIFKQLHPPAQSESQITSRPPERCNPFGVLCVSPLGPSPVSLTCFMSIGRSLCSILARFNWLHSVQSSSSTYRPSWISERLALLQRLCQQPAENHHSDSLNLCSYSFSH